MPIIGLGKLYPVSGTVTYNGGTIEKGQINFPPEDAEGVGSGTGVGANGTIENGSYAMGTLVIKEMCAGVKYKVIINPRRTPRPGQGGSKRTWPNAPTISRVRRRKPHTERIHGQGDEGGQKPHSRRLRRPPDHDPHGRGEGKFQHDSTSLFRIDRCPAGPAQGYRRQKPSQVIVLVRVESRR